MDTIKALKAKVVEEINYRSCTLRSVHETTQALLSNGDLIKAANMTDAEQKKFTGFELDLIRLIDKLDSPDTGVSNMSKSELANV